MNTVTRNNVSVWARRFKVTIDDMPRACAVADQVYKNPTRKGSILVNAMKKVAQEMGVPDELSFCLRCSLCGSSCGLHDMLQGVHYQRL